MTPVPRRDRNRVGPLLDPFHDAVPGAPGAGLAEEFDGSIWFHVGF